MQGSLHWSLHTLGLMWASWCWGQTCGRCKSSQIALWLLEMTSLKLEYPPTAQSKSCSTTKLPSMGLLLCWKVGGAPSGCSQVIASISPRLPTYLCTCGDVTSSLKSINNMTWLPSSCQVCFCRHVSEYCIMGIQNGQALPTIPRVVGKLSMDHSRNRGSTLWQSKEKILLDCKCTSNTTNIIQEDHLLDRGSDELLDSNNLFQFLQL